MRWEDYDHGRSAGSRKRRFSGLPIPGRLVLGSMAIAAIILAIVSNPPQLPRELPMAAPQVKPTTVAAAIIPIPTIAPAVAAPTAAPTSVPSAATGQKIHEVAQGETLSTIAKKYYGDVNKWSKIMDANKDVLKNPDSLQLGQKLKIPD